MGPSKGLWYQDEIGHVYVIGIAESFMDRYPAIIYRRLSDEVLCYCACHDWSEQGFEKVNLDSKGNKK